MHFLGRFGFLASRAAAISMAQIHGLGLGLPPAYERRLAGEQRWLIRRTFVFWRGLTPSYDRGWDNVVRVLRGWSPQPVPPPQFVAPAPPPQRVAAQPAPPPQPEDDGGGWDAIIAFLREDAAEPTPWNYVPRWRSVSFRYPLEDP